MSEKCATLEHGVPGIVWGLQKKFKSQKWKKNGLSSVKKWHSANHRFAECQDKALGKGLTAAAGS